MVSHCLLLVLELESEVSKRTVGFCHTVHIFLALEGSTLAIECIHNLCCKLVCHGLTTTLASKEDEVLHGDRFLTLGADFRWHLEGSTTDTAALDFYLGSDVVERSLPDLKSSLIFLLDLLAYDLKRGVEDIEGDILLTVVHQVINELRHLYVTKYGIR